MSAKLHFREHINNQLVLFPERIDKDIAPDDPVRLVNAVVDSLDMGRIYSLYYDHGASPYHPRMMLKVIIYSYMNNIYSCRKMENALKRDVHFIWRPGPTTRRRTAQGWRPYTALPPIATIPAVPTQPCHPLPRYLPSLPPPWAFMLPCPFGHNIVMS